MTPGVLIGQETQDQFAMGHRRAQSVAVHAPFEEPATGALAKFEQEAIQARLLQGAVGRGELKPGQFHRAPRIKLEVPKMTNRKNGAAKFAFRCLKFLATDNLQM